MSKPLFVTKPSIPSFDEYCEEIKSIWDNKILTNMGPLSQKFEKELLRYLNVSKIMLFVNGHFALEMAIQAFHLTGEVITTPFTFASTTHAISRNGLKPVFCDIEPHTGTMDVTKIEQCITEKTTAIVPVHVYGNICNTKEIQRIAEKHGLKVIYDAAHAFGETVNGESVATFGDASMFSFHATKAFNTIEGGAVVYKDTNVGEIMYNLKNFGIRSQESVVYIGANAKMNEFQAAMGICNLRHLENEIKKRKAAVELYLEGLRKIEGIRIMCDFDDKSQKRNYAYLPILINEKQFGTSRDEIFKWMGKNDVHCRKYFYPLVSNYACYKEHWYDDLPIAKEIASSVLTLPIFADITEDDIARVLWLLKQAQNVCGR